MATSTHRRPAAVAVFGLFVALLAWSAAGADEVKEFTGYTRPGSPDDTQVEGKIIFVADDEEARKEAFGGTVYFAVLELAKGGEGDAWGTGIKDFTKTFKLGIDIDGTSSPALDTSAKYLYLYQTVNDRRTLGPIQSTTVKLIVDMKEITSWGYFAGIGFATPGTGVGDNAGPIRPVAFSNVVAASEADKAYRSPAPAVLAPKPFLLTRIPTRRDVGLPRGQQGVVAVVWDALDPATDPDTVLMLPRADFKYGPCVRAVWNGDNALKKGQRGTVFGFTSNLPPKLEAVRLRGEHGKAGGVRFAADAASEAAGKPTGGRADGEVPTPVSMETTAASASAAPAGGFLAPPAGAAGAAVAPVGVSGGAGGGVPAVGSGTLAPVPTGGGGGALGSSSGGQQPFPQQVQNQNQSQPQTQTVIVNNSLQQQQQQRQQQQQNDGGTPGNIVPEPSAWVLALIGAPFLLLLRRRRH